MEKGNDLAKLNPRQEQFKNNLLKGMGEREAYESVEGFVAKGKAAAANASRLLRNANFAAEYDKARKRAANRAEATKARIIKEECRIAYSDIGELFNGTTTIAPGDLPEDVRRAISGIEIKDRVIVGNDDEQVVERTYKYKFWDKGRALERMEKHLGMFEKDNKQRGGDALTALLEKIAEQGPPRPMGDDTDKCE